MADDHEALDWGGEDDEHLGEGLQRTASGVDADDVVSIGGEEDDAQELAAFQSRSMGGKADETSDAGAGNEKPPAEVVAKTSFQRDSVEEGVPPSSPPMRNASKEAPMPPDPPQRRSRSPPRFTHALPPKPSVAPVPIARSSSFVGATAMSGNRTQDKDSGRRRTNGSRPANADNLPPDWEARHSSSGEIYYYNTRSFVSQWEHPSADADGKMSVSRTTDFERDDQLDRQLDDKVTKAVSSGDLRSDRSHETQRGPERPRLPSPSCNLSYDDRHYRPQGVEVSSSRGGPRDRRGHSPGPVPVRDVSRNDTPRANSLSRGRERAEKDISYAQQSDPDDRRRRRASPAPPEMSGYSRRDLPRSEAERMPRESDRGRGLGLRRGGDSAPDRRDVRVFVDRPGSTTYTPTQFKEPPPRSREDLTPPSQRRNRSPPPQSRSSEGLRTSNDLPRTYEEPVPDRDHYRRVPSAKSFDPLPSSRQSQWDRATPGHHATRSPVPSDLPVRRPREIESTGKAGFEMDVKRRRVDGMSGDSTRARRAPSPSLDGRETFRSNPYARESEGRPERYGSTNDGKPKGPAMSFDSLKQDEGWLSRRPALTDSVGHPREASFDDRAGPRKRQDSVHFPRERQDYADNRRRDVPHDSHPGYERHAKRDDRDSRRMPDQAQGSPRWTDVLEPMDIDSSHSRISILPPTGFMRSDRMDIRIEKHETTASHSVVPRAGRENDSRLSPEPYAPSPMSRAGDRIPPGGTVGSGRRSPPIEVRRHGGIRSDDGEESRRPFRDRRESVANQVAPNKEQPGSGGRYIPPSVLRRQMLQNDELMPWQRTDVPTAPRSHRQTSAVGVPSPKLTGANNVPVPARKGWKAEGVDLVSESNETQRELAQGRSQASQKERQSEVVRGAKSPEMRYNNLHGDVERRMSLNDKSDASELDSKIRPSNPPSEALESHAPRRSGQRVSRFSKPNELPEEPRVWIPREVAETMQAPLASTNSLRATSPLRSPGAPGSRASNDETRIPPQQNPDNAVEPTSPRFSQLSGHKVDSEVTTMTSLQNGGGGGDRDSSTGAIHPSRLSNLHASGPTTKASETVKQVDASSERRSAQAGPIRIRRPQTRIEDSQQQTTPEMTAGAALQQDNNPQGRPSPPRSNSLLERLNMNKDVDSSSQYQSASLRERVRPPARRNDIDIVHDVDKEDVGPISTDAYRGRPRGSRNRSGRGRRGKGRV